MKRFLLFMLVTFVLGLVSTTAQSEQNKEQEFIFEGATFQSQQAFIAGGHRCATALTEVDIKALQTEIYGPTTEYIEEADATFRKIKTIKTYFHVITNNTGFGNVSDEQIASQISVLNEAFQKSEFFFDLVKTDRTANSEWFNMPYGMASERNAKTALRKGGAEALNIYSCIPGDWILGYAYYPSNYSRDPILDGIVILFTTLPGGSAVPYNLGDTATHEAGHWFGLLHTFEGGCVKNKRIGGDHVKDTPAEAAPAYGCPINRDSCIGDGRGGFKGIDPTDNFMDYTDDACMDKFTDGQSKRMRQQFAQYR